MMLALLLAACADLPQTREVKATSRQFGEARIVATTPDWTVEGSEADDSFGLAVTGAGDVNADGYDDVLVSAPFAANAGQVLLFLGSPTGPVAATVLSGDAANAQFGALAALGDINQDGYDDVAVGSPRATFTGIGGEIAIYPGNAAGLDSTSTQVLGGGGSYDSFGWALDAGDINGDGAVDLLTGSPYASTAGDTTGVVRVLLGDGGRFLESTGSFYGNPDDRTGYSVAAGGDIDADGYEDLAFGVPLARGGATGSGKAFVYYGDSNWPNSTFSTNLAGAEVDGWFGWSVDLVGDLDADGFTDVVIGAPFEDNANGVIDAGCAYVFYGASTGIANSHDQKLCGDTDDQALGAEVHGGGDINLDGFDELLLASPFADVDLGVVQIFAGSASGLATTPTLTLNGATPVGGFGASVAAAGDTNNDGYGEVIVGQPGISVIGQAHIFGLAVDADGDGSIAALDCDDQNAAITPGAVDVCDDLDNDCDLSTDEGEDERCDDIDNDCDRSIDEGEAIGAQTWYMDADSDGFGDPGSPVVACVLPPGCVDDALDCEDGDADIHPLAPETCDGRDEDCDGSIDEEASDAPLWYTDGDGDGWGLESEVLANCEEPSGKSARAGDCDDANGLVFPGAFERSGDGLDNDCDGLEASAQLGGGCAGCAGSGGAGVGLLGGLLAIGSRARRRG